MGLPLLDCLRRGVANTVANWPLVGLVLLQRLLTGALVVAGFVPLVVALGGGALISGLAAEDLDSALAQLPWTGGWSDLWLPLLAGAAVATIVWTGAFVLYCYFQGGLYGLLLAGEERTARRTARRAFAVFSLARFDRRGRRLVGRYFWLLNLFALVYSIVVLAAFGALVLLVPGVERSIAAGSAGGAAVAVVVAGGVVLTSVATGVVLTVWLAVAQAEAALERGTLSGVVRRSLALLGSRLGAVVGVLLFAWLASLVASSMAMPFWLLAAAAWRGGGWQVLLGFQLALVLVQWVAGAAVSVGRAASLVSLAKSEAAGAPA